MFIQFVWISFYLWCLFVYFYLFKNLFFIFFIYFYFYFFILFFLRKFIKTFLIFEKKQNTKVIFIYLFIFFFILLIGSNLKRFLKVQIKYLISSTFAFRKYNYTTIHYKVSLHLQIKLLYYCKNVYIQYGLHIFFCCVWLLSNLTIIK